MPWLQGKVEMELELITMEEAETKPAGSGREEPNANPTLEPPKSVQFSTLQLTDSLCLVVLCDLALLLLVTQSVLSILMCK